MKIDGVPVTVAWLDATAGVAGDMLLGSLVDAGVPLHVLQDAVDAVAPGAVTLSCETVLRAGLRAAKVDVVPLVEDQPHRHWGDIRSMLEAAPLPAGTRDRALTVFGRLADAEARVHGVPVDRVHFHEVGSLDSIADIVGVSAGLHHLGIEVLTVSPVSLGSGRIRAVHGDMPVPVPAVLELSQGWQVRSGGEGELATPTGMAIIAALAEGSRDLPELVVRVVGTGAGTKDFAGRPNVVRLVLGKRHDPTSSPTPQRMTVLETNVDDLDPRVWPSVLASLLDAGAADAWLVPIVMKKGRPAHTLSVLAPTNRLDAVRELIFTSTSTIGIRETDVRRPALDRSWVSVAVAGVDVRVKVASRGREIVHATPEFEDVVSAANRLGLPVRRILEEATARLVADGLVSGGPLPER